MRPFTAMRNDTSAAPAGASGGPAQGTAPRLPPGVIAAPAWIRPQSCHAPPRPILLPHYHAPPRPILLPHNHAPPTRPILLPHYHAAPPRPIPFSCSITMRHLLGLFSCSTARTIHDASPALSYYHPLGWMGAPVWGAVSFKVMEALGHWGTGALGHWGTSIMPIN